MMQMEAMVSINVIQTLDVMQTHHAKYSRMQPKWYEDDDDDDDDDHDDHNDDEAYVS